jgi:hypothetical protein
MSEHARKYTDHPNKHVISNIFGQLYEPIGPDKSPETDSLSSEDYSFCKRWRDLGGRVMVYLNAGRIVHAGSHGWSVRDMEREESVK